MNSLQGRSRKQPSSFGGYGREDAVTARTQEDIKTVYPSWLTEKILNINTDYYQTGEYPA